MQLIRTLAKKEFLSLNKIVAIKFQMNRVFCLTVKPNISIIIDFNKEHIHTKIKSFTMNFEQTQILIPNIFKITYTYFSKRP